MHFSNKTITKNIKTAKEDQLFFKHLPAYAAFLLEYHLEDYAKTQLVFFQEEKVPILSFFKHLSDEELIKHAKVSASEFLTVLMENRASEYIQKSVVDYVKNNIPLIEREQLVARDITTISFVRRKLFRTFIGLYTTDHVLDDSIREELDRFVVESEAAIINTYIAIQQEKISSINRELEQQHEDLLEAQELAEMGSFFWDFKGEHSIYTPGAMRIFEMTHKSTLSSFLEYVHKDDRNMLKEAIDKSYESGIYECEYRFIKNNKEKRIWSRGLVNFQDGVAVSMKGTIMDITYKYRMMQELQLKTIQLENLNTSLELKNAALERINKELESFTYIVSHDLQVPLRKIQTFTSRIFEKGIDVLPPDTVEYFDKIMTSSARMQLFIQDLLLFSQATANKSNFESVDLNLILDEVKTILFASIEDKKVMIESTSLHVLKAVPFQLQQLLLNLISNAIKYSKKGTIPYIEISSAVMLGQKLNIPSAIADKNYIELTVKDNGIGFEEEYVEKIFGLFHRLHGKNEYSGTGIGLAICKKIANNHNGFITAKSTVLKGSVFSVYFPQD